MNIQLGDMALNGRVLLAPMSGVTDLAFRKAVANASSVSVVSEMVACEELVKARPEVLRRAEGAGLAPFILQLAGRDPQWMCEGAHLACQAGADIVDINMGCPSRQVTGGLSGSALMRDEGLYLGGSTAINVAGAMAMARELGPGHTIVTILCDSGQRYQSKVWNPAFLREQELAVPSWL